MKSITLCLLLFLVGSSAAQHGLQADYYNGTNFNRYVTSTIVNKIDFYWDYNPPVEGLNPHLCSVRYTGQLIAPISGSIAFSARVDDGIRVWVGGIQVIDNWQLNDVGYSNGAIELEADKSYDLIIEYFNAMNEAELKLFWKLPEEDSWLLSWLPEDKPVLIPTENLEPPILKVTEPEPELEAEPELDPETIQLKPEPTVKPDPIPEPKPEPPTQPVVKLQKSPTQSEEISAPKPVAEAIQKYIPESVEFEQAQSEILAVSYPELDKLADYLVKHPSRQVHIEGHTDYVGDSQKNLLLSKRRANAVAAYLVKKGVKASQLSAEGYGGTRPIVRSAGKKYNPENRRVAFVID